MPPFQAINIEIEEEEEDELNTIRELHVDDALKLFQTALKLHAAGPSSYDDAETAYAALFKSEIFSYPEAATEYERAQRRPEQQTLLDFAVVDADGTGTSLPQALYLAHKNRGQFYLDKIQHQASLSEMPKEEYYQRPETLELARCSVMDFLAALDRDPSDAELWRKTARVAAYLNSGRTSRFCLESAIEMDDDPAVIEVEPPSIAESLAGEQLKEQLQMLGDEMALSHPGMVPWLRQKLPLLLNKKSDPVPFLPNSLPAINQDTGIPSPPEATRTIAEASVVVKESTWTNLGLALMLHWVREGDSAPRIRLHLKNLQNVPEDDQDKVTTPSTISSTITPPSPVSAVFSDADNAVSAVEHLSKTEKGDTDADADVSNTAVKSPIEPSSASADAPDASRKRSQSVAGVAEPEEETMMEKRSKRTRRRETVEEVQDPAVAIAAQLAPIQAADKNLFNITKNMLENLGVTDAAAMQNLDDIIEMCESEDRTSRVSGAAVEELLSLLQTYKEDAVRLMVSKKGMTLSLSAFLEHSKSSAPQQSAPRVFDEVAGLAAFAARVEASWWSIGDVLYEWLRRMMTTYIGQQWPDATKNTVVQIISRADDAIYPRLKADIDDEQFRSGTHKWQQLRNMAQAILELHVEVHASLIRAGTAAAEERVAEVSSRMGRWQALVGGLCSRDVKAGAEDTLSLRFVWVSVALLALGEDAAGVHHRDHVLACWRESRDLFAARVGSTGFDLPNNGFLATMSAGAADREISKLTTMDFFLGLFQDETTDPVAIIESLEPVLNPDAVRVPVVSAGTNDVLSTTEQGEQKALVSMPITECASQRLRDLWKFLDSSDVEVKLYMWTRLAEAYRNIDYPTKEFSCNLGSIGMLVQELLGPNLAATTPEARAVALMRPLKFLDDLVIVTLNAAVNNMVASNTTTEKATEASGAGAEAGGSGADSTRDTQQQRQQQHHSDIFDVVDAEHLRSTVASITRAIVFLHQAAMFEDEVRLGLATQKTHNQTFQSFLSRIRDLQVRLWCLLYLLVRYGLHNHMTAVVNPETGSEVGTTNAVTDTDTELANYLQAMHQVLGPRQLCRASNRIFLQLMRHELLRRRTVENWEDYLGQVLYDLYGLRLGVGLWELEEHHCPPVELERKHALALVERVVLLAQAMPMKELLRSDLRGAVEQIQKAVGQSKATPNMVHNIRNYTELMKRPVLALALYQADNGALMLNAVTVMGTPDWCLARHSWYYLLGMMAFARYTALELAKRQTPGAIDDLRIATTFFRQQLQFVPDRWDCWLRIAQCFDYELDEAVLWSADRINGAKERAELVKLQRQAVHCYALALSYSWPERSLLRRRLRQAATARYKASNPKPEVRAGFGFGSGIRAVDDGIDVDSLYDLYFNFGLRLYSSSREPFAMDVFRHSDFQRFFIELATFDTFKKQAHEEMTPYKVWKFAALMFRRASDIKPREWKARYMYAKCLWKMYQTENLRSDAAASETKIEEIETREIAIKLPELPHEQKQKPTSSKEKHKKHTTTMAMLISALTEAVEAVYVKKKKSRNSSPVLEPHYKILTVIMKLVARRDLAPRDGAAILSKQPFGVPLHGQPKKKQRAAGALVAASSSSSSSAQNAVRAADESDNHEASGSGGSEREKETGRQGGKGEDGGLNLSDSDSDSDSVTSTSSHEALSETNVDRDDEDEWWESYAIRSLNVLRDKDKHNWQHRLIIRQAATLLGGVDLEAVVNMGPGSIDYMQAKAAFNVLRDSMFTKTMAMNVWKCDAERAGRHFVYTERYTRFMISLLVALGDADNLEALLRRLRKKGSDFYHFAELWQLAVVEHMRVLRRVHKVPPLVEDEPFKSWGAEHLDKAAEIMIKWAGEKKDSSGVGAAEDSGLSGPSGGIFAVAGSCLACMKDGVELRKLNAGLLKAGGIDDLIVDAFSRVVLECVVDYPEILAAADKDKEKKDVDGDVTMGAEADVDETKVVGETTAAPAPALVKTRRVVMRRADVVRKAEQIVSVLSEVPAKNGTKETSTGSAAARRGRSRRSGIEEEVKEEENGENEETVLDADVDVDVEGDDSISDLSDVPPDYEEEAEAEGLMFTMKKGEENDDEEDEEESAEDEDGAEDENEADEEQDEGGDEIVLTDDNAGSGKVQGLSGEGDETMAVDVTELPSEDEQERKRPVLDIEQGQGSVEEDDADDEGGDEDEDEDVGDETLA